MGEPTYTREQWEEIMRVEHCQREGHEYDIVVATGPRGEHPTKLLCLRCGLAWDVVSPNV